MTNFHFFNPLYNHPPIERMKDLIAHLKHIDTSRS